MSESFSDSLQGVIDRVQKIIDNLDNTFYKNTEFLKNSYLTAREKLETYRDDVENIILGFRKPSPHKFYPKIEEIKDMDNTEIDAEIQKWDFLEPKFKEIVDNPYKVEDIKVFKTWQPSEVEKCAHDVREVVVTFCGKAHCKVCLKLEIEKKNRRCTCNKELSPKNIHEIMGFTYRLDKIFN